MKKTNIQRPPAGALVERSYTQSEVIQIIKDAEYRGATRMSVIYNDYHIPAIQALSTLMNLITHIDSIVPAMDISTLRQYFRGEANLDYASRLLIAYSRLDDAFRNIRQDIPNPVVYAVATRVAGIKKLCTDDSDYGESLREAVSIDATNDLEQLHNLVKQMQRDPGEQMTNDWMAMLCERQGMSIRAAARKVAIETGMDFEALRQRYKLYEQSRYGTKISPKSKSG